MNGSCVKSGQSTISTSTFAKFLINPSFNTIAKRKEKNIYKYNIVKILNYIFYLKFTIFYFIKRRDM